MNARFVVTISLLAQASLAAPAGAQDRAGWYFGAEAGRYEFRDLRFRGTAASLVAGRHMGPATLQFNLTRGFSSLSDDVVFDGIRARFDGYTALESALLIRWPAGTSLHVLGGGGGGFNMSHGQLVLPFFAQAGVGLHPSRELSARLIARRGSYIPLGMPGEAVGPHTISLGVAYWPSPVPKPVVRIAGPRPGTRVRVTRVEGEAVVGTIVELRPGHLIIDDDAQRRLELPRHAVTRLEVSEGVRSRWAIGMAGGAAAGAFAGFLLGSAFIKGNDLATRDAGLLGVVPGVLAGGLTGAAIGRRHRTERWRDAPLPPE